MIFWSFKHVQQMFRTKKSFFHMSTFRVDIEEHKFPFGQISIDQNLSKLKLKMKQKKNLDFYSVERGKRANFLLCGLLLP